jgi:hypothetical protein
MSTSRYTEELNMLWVMTGGPRGFRAIRWHDPEHGRQLHWVDIEDRVRWMGLVDYLSRDMAVELDVSVAARPERTFGVAPGSAECLWVETTGSKQLHRLEDFMPRPTLVLEHGDTTRRVAFWALYKTLPYSWLITANKRLAHAIGATKKHAGPEFMFHPPGSCLRDGRAKPSLIRVAECNDVMYLPAEVVGKARPDGRALPEAPATDAWRRAAA